MISDQHLLDEIKFLTKLINHHESAPKNVVRAASLSKRTYKVPPKGRPKKRAARHPHLSWVSTKALELPVSSLNTKTRWKALYQPKKAKSKQLLNGGSEFSRTFVPGEPGLCLQQDGSSVKPSTVAETNKNAIVSSTSTVHKGNIAQRVIHTTPSHLSVTTNFQKHRRGSLPLKSQLSWSRGASASVSENPLSKSSAIPPPKFCSSAKNTQFSWKSSKALSSSADSKLSKVPSNPICQSFVKTRYKLRRLSAKGRPISSQCSFTKRRIQYLSNHKKPVKSPSSLRWLVSKNKVWFGGTKSSLELEKAGGARLRGREGRTRQGNKVWLASALTAQDKWRSVASSHVAHQYQRSGARLHGSTSTVAGLKVLKSGNSARRTLASRAVRRSKLYVWKRNRKSATQQYCMFFNRFGRCNKGDKCPYIHDLEKVAVCTKFLRGACEKTDGSCLFSHKISKEKMPVCSFFLRGVCTKDNCPYLHVSVGKDAQVCADFIKGFCPLGEKCARRHVLDCPEHLRTGRCPRGDKCLLRHRRWRPLLNLQQQEGKGPKPTKLTPVREPLAFRKARFKQLLWKGPSALPPHHSGTAVNKHTAVEQAMITPKQLEFIPLEHSADAPDFIAL